jgi:hypothetical protein
MNKNNIKFFFFFKLNYIENEKIIYLKKIEKLN